MATPDFDMRWFLDDYESRGNASAPAGLEQTLTELLSDVRAAWPQLRGLDRLFIAHLAHHLADEGDLLTAVSKVRAADLFLAHACGRGNADGLEVIERDYMESMRGTLRSMRATPSDIDEVLQTVRERLFVTTDQRPARILDYAGRGDLHSWLRAIAGRTYLNHLRKHGREVSTGDEALLTAVSSDEEDPELAHMKQRYRAEFRGALTAAIEELPAKYKNMLRYRYIDELGIGELATLYKVHRATLHRWLADARDELARTTERLLCLQLNISGTEYNSIRRLVVSQLEVSLRRVLAPAG